MTHQSLFASEFLYFPTLGMVKISTLLLFARIFPSHYFHRILWAVGLFISIYTMIAMIVMIFQCRPLNAAWDLSINSDCIDLSKLFIVMGSMNVLTDFLLLCLPLPQLWKLQMHRGTRIQVMGIFSIGSLSVTQSSCDSSADRGISNDSEKAHWLTPNSTTIVSIYRLPQLHSIHSYRYDPSWSIIEPAIWSLVEIGAATLAACAITFRPLFNWVFRIRQSSASGGFRREINRIGATRSSHVSTRTRLVTDIGPNIKMQALNVIHSSAPTSSQVPRATRTEDGFRRLQEPTEVPETGQAHTS